VPSEKVFAAHQIDSVLLALSSIKCGIPAES
jgi:hypothetical protein